MIKFIKCFIFFNIFFYSRVLVSMEKKWSRDVNIDYKRCICLPRKRNNVLLTVGVLSTLGAVYYIANKTNKKILQGESFTGVLQRCNVYKDKIFLVDQWIKKFIVPVGIYLTIGNYFNKKNNIEYRNHNIGKLMMRNDAHLIIEKSKLQDIAIYNSFSESTLGTWLEGRHFLHPIFHPIRNRFEIYFAIATKKNSNEKATDYYQLIEKIENEIENFDEKKQTEVLNLEEFFDKSIEQNEYLFMDFLQKICNHANEKLKKDFDNQRIKLFWLTAGLVFFCSYLVYRCFLGKKYIEKHGLGHCDILTRFLYDNQWFWLNKVICANVDWVYWSLGFMQYVILPGLSLIFFLKYLAYKNNNNLAYNLNKVFGWSYTFFVFWTLKKAEEYKRSLKKAEEYKNKLSGVLSEELLCKEDKAYEENIESILKNQTEEDKKNSLTKIKTFMHKMFSYKSLKDLCDMLYHKT